jgi:acyl-CoA thioester hydrolase
MATDFRFETDVTVRFRDLDAMGRVHNSVVLGYVEEARAAYFREVLGTPLADTEGALARQTVDYERPLTRETAVEVAYRVQAVGESSLDTAFVVRADGEPAARGTVVHVVLDDGEPAAVPEGWVERIEAFEPALEGCDGDSATAGP